MSRQPSTRTEPRTAAAQEWLEHWYPGGRPSDDADGYLARQNRHFYDEDAAMLAKVEAEAATPADCPYCEGRGNILENAHLLTPQEGGPEPYYRECAKCGGTGAAAPAGSLDVEALAKDLALVLVAYHSYAHKGDPRTDLSRDWQAIQCSATICVAARALLAAAPSEPARYTVRGHGVADGGNDPAALPAEVGE